MIPQGDTECRRARVRVHASQVARLEAECALLDAKIAAVCAEMVDAAQRQVEEERLPAILDVLTTIYDALEEREAKRIAETMTNG